MFKTKVVFLMITLCLTFKIKAQVKLINENPLKINSTVPEAIWNLSLQVVNHPESTPTITLNDYRDKLIILDFMNTRCSGCIAKLPLFDSLQKADNRIKFLIITPDSDNMVSSFLQKNKIGTTLSLMFVSQDTVLKKAFPHRYISHIGWLYQNQVKAITGAKYVTENNIRLILNRQEVDIPVKDDSK